MEDLWLYGLEGNGQFVLYRDEVDMRLPVAETETFNIVNSTPLSI